MIFKRNLLLVAKVFLNQFRFKEKINANHQKFISHSPSENKPKDIMCACVYKCTQKYIYICRLYTCVYICVYKYIYIYIHLYKCIYTHIPKMCVCVFIEDTDTIFISKRLFWEYQNDSGWRKRPVEIQVKMFINSHCITTVILQLSV